MFHNHLRVIEIKLQKGVDRLKSRPYMALTETETPTNNRQKRFGRQHKRTTVPRYEKSGYLGCPLHFVGGSLTLLVLDEGTCGRRRPIRGASGSVYGLFKSLPHMSFVSITFDKCRYRLLKFDIAVSGFTRAVIIVTQT